MPPLGERNLSTPFPSQVSSGKLGEETRCTVDAFQTCKTRQQTMDALGSRSVNNHSLAVCVCHGDHGDVGDDIQVIVMLTWFLFVAGVFWST